ARATPHREGLPPRAPPAPDPGEGSVRATPPPLPRPPLLGGVPQTVMTGAATGRPSQRLFTFRRSAAPVKLVETPQTYMVGHATLYRRRLVSKVADARSRSERSSFH